MFKNIHTSNGQILDTRNTFKPHTLDTISNTSHQSTVQLPAKICDLLKGHMSAKQITT